jgi:signal transduction histidine kinase
MPAPSELPAETRRAPAGALARWSRSDFRVHWHPKGILALAVMLVGVLLAGFAYVATDSQAQSRSEAQRRFLAQATIAAGLTRAIFTATQSPDIAAATKLYGRAVPSTPALEASVKRAHLAFAEILGPWGVVLAHTHGAAAESTTAAVAAAISQAHDGTAWFSDLFRDPSGQLLMAEAIPFPTHFGRRVEVMAFPASTFSSFLGNFLDGALPDRTAHAFVLDGHGRLLASSVAGVATGKTPSSQFTTIVSSAPVNRPVHGEYDVTTGPFRGDRYVVAAPIPGSHWRVGVTEPTSTLYPANVGSLAWVIWAVFAAFAAAALGCLLLLRRTLKTAGVVVAQAQRVEAANAELKAINEELNAFSYSVSHDLRAPLRAIDGFSRIVVEEDGGELNETQRRYLGLVRENTLTMDKLIDDLLSFSRLASQPVQRVAVDTGRLVHELEDELGAEQPDHPVDFVNGWLPMIEADPALVRQVFANVLGNAVKYSRMRDRSRVVVGCERRGGELVFSVADNGVGFDMRYADKLFSVFQRLHRAEDYEGTGVGLAIVQRIVSRHGGRIWAEGEPDAGATFHFTLEAAS